MSSRTAEATQRNPVSKNQKKKKEKKKRKMIRLHHKVQKHPVDSVVQLSGRDPEECEALTSVPSIKINRTAETLGQQKH